MSDQVRESGIHVELHDGRKGIAYTRDQVRGAKMLIRLVTDNMEPLISEETQKQAIVFKHLSEIKTIGYIN